MIYNKNTKFLENILKYAYSSQRGNNLLLTFFAQKKIEEKEFNLYIYLDIDLDILGDNDEEENIENINKKSNKYNNKNNS